MAQVPGPVRAVLGLIATAAEEVRTLPDKAVELPVVAISSALQMSLRAQQRYAGLTVKGDEMIGRLRGTSDDPPSWATIDDGPPAARSSRFDAARDPEPFDPDPDDILDLDHDVPLAGLGMLDDPPKSDAASAEPAKKALAKKAPAKKAPAKKAPGKKASAKKAPGKKAPAKKTSAEAETTHLATPAMASAPDHSLTPETSIGD